MSLSAGRDVTITTSDTASSGYHYKDVKKSGLASARRHLVWHEPDDRYETLAVEAVRCRCT
ncbi:hypothetical protein [Burkholderia latens]|uniref:hypothetical protein n=1 Tax=Burkholderia latens TaxID=488446 RepID=UPI0018D216C5|nr:hypothetical protein [Burkholderia latens]